MAFGCGFALVIITVFLLTYKPRQSYVVGRNETFDLAELALRYRPMLRLLDGSDFQVLEGSRNASWRGSFRSQRRAIFRAYLRNLRQDHARLCAQIRFQLLHNSEDCPDLAASLLKMETVFDLMMFSVNLRLLFHAAGFGTVSVSGLMNSFEQIRQQAERLTTPPATAIAAFA